jgi:dCTP deaminase
MFWSGLRLEQNLTNLVLPANKSKIDCAAITLSIGDEIYISPSSSLEHQQVTNRLRPRATFWIPSGQFAFLLTKEVVSIPDNALAFISMKSKVKMSGLVNVSGFDVDPGYKGKLIFAVFNAGPKAVTLREGDDCFLMWLADTDAPNSTYIKKGTGFSEISTEFVNRIPGKNTTLEVLSGRIDQIERSVTISNRVTYLLIPILATIAVAGIALFDDEIVRAIKILFGITPHV